ncbi:MAG: F0F1 ATP synthase subunit A [Verrucomicrobia bacterium]|nr:F0F1 ATP synthase subunit A [Verrucomicrobiota bacterium]
MQATIILAAGEITVQPNRLLPSLGWFTNSFVFTVIVTGLIIIVARSATRKMDLVPKGAQNFIEALVETLYDTFENIVGRHMIAKVFPVIATLFIFICAANWIGLVPGVGTIGWGKPGPGLFSLSEIDRPLLRPADADLNMTLGMAIMFMILWLIWTLRDVGLLGFLKENFAPKGQVGGWLGPFLIVIFLFVGCIEILSILLRPVSLSLRLFGNIFAGETLLHTMTTLGLGLPVPLNWIAAIVFPLPFFFLELLVGVLQALVFSALCGVYIRLSTHQPEPGGAGH